MSIQDIKRISIRAYLGAMGITSKWERGNRGMYFSPFRKESNASFSVDFDKNLWYDHGTGEGGSIIDLVARMENCSAIEAIARLDGNRSLPAVSGQPANDCRKIEIRTVNPLIHPVLINYLHGRGIGQTVARVYCKQAEYTIGGKEFFAIGFKNDTGG